MKFRIQARHKNWVVGATITESHGDDKNWTRRFTATIRGYRNWKIYQGAMTPKVVWFVVATARRIRDRIDANDESVFDEPNEFVQNIAG